MRRSPGSFVCQLKDTHSPPPFPVRRSPAALRFAANDPAIGSLGGEHAGRDIHLIGSNVVSEQGNIRLHAERDTNLVAVKDSEYEYTYRRTDQSFGRSETHISESYQQTLAGGVLNAGGSVLINTEAGLEGAVTLGSENVNIAGGVVQAGNHVLVGAGHDINITGMNTAERDYQESKSSGFGGFSNSASGSVSDSQHWQAAQVNAGGSVVMDSGNNLSLKGVDVSAGENIELEALDKVLITHGSETSNSESWDKSSGLFTGGDLYASHESRAGDTTGTAVGSRLQAEGAVIVDSGSTTLVGSDLHGEQGVQITADIGDVEVLAAANTTERFSFEESKTVGLGDMVEGLSDGEGPVQNQDGRLTVKIADATYDRVETQTHIKDMTGSHITSGNHVVVDAAGDITVEGSTLAAGVGADDGGQSVTASAPNDSVAPTGGQAQAPQGEGNTGPENSVVLNAGGNVTLKEATNTYESETKEVHGKAELSVVVQHQAAEVAKAAIAVKDARDKLKDAKRDLKDYENNLKQLQNNLAQMEADYENGEPGINYNDLLEMRELVDDVEGDKEWYQGGVALAAANLTAKTTALVQQSAAAAQSTGTYGFNAGVQLDIDASKSKETIKETTSLASNVTGENIHIQTGVGQQSASGTSTTIQGSHLNAENRLAINTGELNVLASRDTLEIDNQSEQAHITAQMTVYGASGGASISGDYSRSKSGEKHTTYTNSTLLADNMTLNTTDDVTIRGGNVRADTALNATIGGDLTVESVQNRSRTQNNSLGVSGGFSLGGNDNSAKKDSHWQGSRDLGGASGAHGGLNASNGMSVTRETVRSSLTSGGSADITVAGNTQITAATIGTIDEEGDAQGCANVAGAGCAGATNDLGNLNLTTGSLNFTNLRDIHQSSQTSGSISTSVGIGDNPLAEDGKGREMTVNTSNLTYSNTSEYSAGNSLATLGTGTITVGGTLLEENGELTEAGTASDSPLAGLNRDTANTTYDLWDVERTEGNIDLQVDHRFFSEEGRAEIGHEMGEFGDNIQIISQDVPAPAGGNAVENAVGGFLNKLGEWTYGILPSDANAGGLIAQIPVLFGNNDIKAGAVQVLPANDEYVLSNPDAFMPASELPYYDTLDAEGQAKFEGVVVSRDFMAINSETATYQNHTNGILNNLPQALVNAMEQTDSSKVTSHYNPTHGGVPDLLESLIDKTFGNGVIQTGVASQTGEFVKDVVISRADNGSNFIAHSQGSLLMNAGLNTLDKNDFSGVTYSNEENIPTFFINGAPVQAGTMETTVGNMGFNFAGSAANNNDSVAELLGRNRGTYIPSLDQGSADPIPVVDSLYNGLKNLPKLGDDKYPEYDSNGNQANELSPHSTYDCKINCGDKP